MIMSSPALYIHDEIVHNKEAARIILPIVFKFVNPSSVIDIGCGLGTWLAVCEELGVKDYLGIDGDYVNTKMLTFPMSNFRTTDLRNKFDFNRKFDLVICLEVAEHIQESSTDNLIKSLVKHGDTILFSAAIPGQGGQNHVNEQWPKYWQEKFKPHGFYFHDVIRPKIWDNAKVEWWYRQNIFLVNRTPPDDPLFNSLEIVHPELFKQKINDGLEFYNSILSGKQGVKLSLQIFVNALIYATKVFFGKTLK